VETSAPGEEPHLFRVSGSAAVRFLPKEGGSELWVYPGLKSRSGQVVPSARQVKCPGKGACPPEECHAACLRNPHCEAWSRWGAGSGGSTSVGLAVRSPARCLLSWDVQRLQSRTTASSLPDARSYAGRVR